MIFLEYCGMITSITEIGREQQWNEANKQSNYGFENYEAVTFANLNPMKIHESNGTMADSRELVWVNSRNRGYACVGGSYSGGNSRGNKISSKMHLADTELAIMKLRCVFNRRKKDFFERLKAQSVLMSSCQDSIQSSKSTIIDKHISQLSVLDAAHNYGQSRQSSGITTKRDAKEHNEQKEIAQFNKVTPFIGNSGDEYGLNEQQQSKRKSQKYSVTPYRKESRYLAQNFSSNIRETNKQEQKVPIKIQKQPTPKELSDRYVSSTITRRPSSRIVYPEKMLPPPQRLSGSRITNEVYLTKQEHQRIKNLNRQLKSPRPPSNSSSHHRLKHPTIIIPPPPTSRPLPRLIRPSQKIQVNTVFINQYGLPLQGLKQNQNVVINLPTTRSSSVKSLRSLPGSRFVVRPNTPEQFCSSVISLESRVVGWHEGIRRPSSSRRSNYYVQSFHNEQRAPQSLILSRPRTLPHYHY